VAQNVFQERLHSDQFRAGPTASPLYAEALAVVLLHELLDSGRVSAPPAHGGLAYSQRRAVLQ
jgi:hypothetical protein